MYVCMYVFMYVCMYVCMYVFMYVRMFVCMYSCMHFVLGGEVDLGAYVCVCMYVHTHTPVVSYGAFFFLFASQTLHKHNETQKNIWDFCRGK